MSSCSIPQPDEPAYGVAVLPLLLLCRASLLLAVVSELPLLAFHRNLVFREKNAIVEEDAPENVAHAQLVSCTALETLQPSATGDT